MTFGEAMVALEHGKRVRAKVWDSNRFVYKSGKNTLIDDSEKLFYLDLQKLMDEEWEIYEETTTLRELLGYTIRFNGRKYYVVPYVLQRIHLNNEIITEVALMPLDQLSTPLTWIRLSFYHKIPINDILKTSTDNGITILG